MSLPVSIRDEARFDVIDAAFYLAEKSLDAADRFATAVGASYERLADFPGAGTIREFENPRLTGMRMWPVAGFPNYLIFYRATDKELEIIRVIHGARDLSAIFASEEDDTVE